MQCQSCSHDTKSIIPLGKIPLANALAKSKKECNVDKYNLEVMLCDNCGLAQLKDIIPPEMLFTDYVYFSSNSDTMLKSAKTLVDRISECLDKNSFVVEIASNDGYLLKNYIARGINSLGIDPAENIAKIANQNGIPTLCAFFSEETAHQVVEQYKKADIIHANNVMAHVPNINDFVKGIKILLSENGKAVIEVPYFAELYNKLEFDTIYHEHVYYFAVKPLVQLFDKHGLELFDIEKLKIHGGSLRLFVGHKNCHQKEKVISEMLNYEKNIHLDQSKNYEQFINKINGLKISLTELLADLKARNKKIAAYGASAKSTTLLNYFGIGHDYIDFIVDRSAAKIGLVTPGTCLEIKSPTALLDEQVDYAVLLTWNFADEIIEQQQDFLANGGKFILPLPEVKILP